MPARCFLGLGLPPSVRRLLSEAERAFLGVAPEWTGEKWVRPGLLHVTVKFIGALPDPAVEQLVETLGQRLAAVPPFELTLTGLRSVPGQGRARMLWATYAGDVEASVSLAACCDEVLASGFEVEPEDRAFKPHTTLVRTRRPRAVPRAALSAADAAIEGGKESDRIVSVLHVTLYSSTLGNDGPTYETIAKIPLRR